MLSDKEQAALNAFLDTQIDLFVRTNLLMPPLEFNRALFAAGIAYATKRAAAICRARKKIICGTRTTALDHECEKCAFAIETAALPPTEAK